jgi:hypothetical protein
MGLGVDRGAGRRRRDVAGRKADRVVSVITETESLAPDVQVDDEHEVPDSELRMAPDQLRLDQRRDLTTVDLRSRALTLRR